MNEQNEKVYDLTLYGKTHKIVLAKDNYCENGTLAVLMIEIMKDGTEEYWGTLTVNIDDSNFMADSKKNAFIDTNNNGNEISTWLRNNKIAKATGFLGFSGYCAYPLFSFTEQALKGMRVL